jgi:hypothetical protein
MIEREGKRADRRAGAQIRRTVLREDRLRPLRPGRPCMAPALATWASGTSDVATIGDVAANENPTESRPTAPVKSAGLPPL